MVSVQIPDEQHGMLKIYDLTGTLVMIKYFSNAGLFQLNLNTLSAGIYMLTLAPVQQQPMLSSLLRC